MCTCLSVQQVKSSAIQSSSPRVALSFLTQNQAAQNAPQQIRFSVDFPHLPSVNSRCNSIFLTITVGLEQAQNNNSYFQLRRWKAATTIKKSHMNILAIWTLKCRNNASLQLGSQPTISLWVELGSVFLQTVICR